MRYRVSKCRADHNAPQFYIDSGSGLHCCRDLFCSTPMPRPSLEGGSSETLDRCSPLLSTSSAVTNSCIFIALFARALQHAVQNILNTSVSHLLCAPQDVKYGPGGALGLARTWPQAAGMLPTPGTAFDWEGDRPLNLPLEELIIYEMHVRGFTWDASSNVSSPGVLAALCLQTQNLVTDLSQFKPMHGLLLQASSWVNTAQMCQMCVWQAPLLG